MNIQEQILENLKSTSEESINSPENIEKTSIFFAEANEVLNDLIKKSDRKLGDKFEERMIKKECISDGFIEEHYNGSTIQRPIIDVVQQGGGMLGIALLGYTYTMEKIGIRFYSHGGTSAGAINALFLASISNEIYTENSKFQPGNQAIKSEILTHIIANTDFSNFMERKGIIGWFQQKLFRNYKSIVIKLLLSVFCLGFLIGIYGLFGFVFNYANGLSGRELRVFDFIIGTLNVGALIVFIYILLVKV